MATTEHKHPNYMAIWAWLAGLTVAEVLVATLSHIPRHWLVLALLVMAIWKALLVALYFMHLRFEPRRLWPIVLAPLPLAVIMVMVILQEF
ncbi:MAG: cytochrome C oxidase subunit IV family protein [Gemmatimonadales bacterium]|jgi:cytochrome c oxidase subunit 4